MKAAVLALGSWGTALCKVLADNGHEVAAWARDDELVRAVARERENRKYLPGVFLPESIRYTADRDDAVAGADMIVFAVPTQQFRGVYAGLASTGALRPETLIVNVAKGIEIASGRTISSIVAEYTPNARFCCFSGPTHAEEIGKQFPAAIVAASSDRMVAKAVQDAMSNSYLRVYTNEDVIGVEISGALKNIIALATGVVDGLGFGDNAKAALITRGIHEITRLGLAMGARKETFAGLAGVGDLIVTCMSMHSRNRRAGIRIGEGKTLEEAVRSVGMVVEGVHTCRAAYEIKEKLGVEMPITTELYRVLYEGKDARSAIAELMSRDKKHEIDEDE